MISELQLFHKIRQLSPKGYGLLLQFLESLLAEEKPQAFTVGMWQKRLAAQKHRPLDFEHAPLRAWKLPEW